MGYTIYEYANQLYSDWYYHKLMIEEAAKTASMAVGPEGVKVDFDNETNWLTVAKLVVSILTTYLGYKLINKFVQ